MACQQSSSLKDLSAVLQGLKRPSVRQDVEGGRLAGRAGSGCGPYQARDQGGLEERQDVAVSRLDAVRK